MKTKRPDAFMRATPSKISITETYWYKAQVHKYVSFEFQKATGEIKLEYLCDGENRDRRWRLRIFRDDLTAKVSIFKGLKRFFTKKWPKRITKWLGLRWLAYKLERLCLGEPLGQKCFGVAALSDADRWGNSQSKARVGYLVLRGYTPPHFSENWPEHRPVPLDLPIDHLKHELGLSQKNILTYKYTLIAPSTIPVHLPNIKLTDVLDDDNKQLHSEYDEVLKLEIPLVVDVGPSQVNEEGRIPRDMVIQWWSDATKKDPDEEEENEKNNQGDDEDIQLEQIRIVKSQDMPTAAQLKNHLEYLARRRGGYVLIRVNNIHGSDEKTLEAPRQKLKLTLIQAAFQCIPFVPIFEPYDYPLEKSRLFVVPVPMVPPRGYDGRRYTESEDRYPNFLWIRSPETVPVYQIIKNEANKKRLGKQLAEILAALANTEGGGSVFLEAGPDDKYDEDYETPLENAAWGHCWPPLSSKILGWVEMNDRRGRGLHVDRASNEVHSVDGVVCLWENGQLKRLTWAEDQPDKAKKEVIEKVFKLMVERCKLDLPVVEPRPSIVYGFLKGPCFDAREEQGAQYDPFRKILKWTKPIPFERESKRRTYKATLPVWMNRPVELYEFNDLEGAIQVDFPQKLLSGLNIAYFNALGEQINLGRSITFEKISKVRIEFDPITLHRVFQWREFTASREFQFEGVRLSYDRLVDIQGMLADLGLEHIDVWVRDLFQYSSRLDVIPVDQVLKHFDGYRVSGWRPDGLHLNLFIDGELTNINRERQEGKRIDRMRIPSGRMRIKIKGRVEGERVQAQELSLILNRLQRLLKERFSSVRMQVP